MNGFYAAKDYPKRMQRIRINDPDSGKAVVFPTDNVFLPPLTIAALYT